MRTRIALAAAMAAASTTTIIITNNIAAAGIAVTGHRKVPARHARSTRSGPGGDYAAFGQGSALAPPRSAGLVDFTQKPGTGSTVDTRGTAGLVRSIAAEVSMSNALQRVGAVAVPAPTAPGAAAAPPVAVAAPAAPAPPPPPPPTDATSTATADWQCIRIHESGDVYNDPARPSGAYGILVSTWHSYGLSGWPYEAPAASQDDLALTLYHRYGWAPWSTRYICGLG